MGLIYLYMFVTRGELDVWQCFGKLTRRKSDAKKYGQENISFTLRKDYEKQSGYQLLESSRLNEM